MNRGWRLTVAFGLALGTIAGCAAGEDVADEASEGALKKKTDARFDVDAENHRQVDAELTAYEKSLPVVSGRFAAHCFQKSGKARGSIVVYHGFGGDPGQVNVWSQYFCDNGYNVIAPNLAGQHRGPESWMKVQLKPETQKNIVTQFLRVITANPAKFPRLARAAVAQGQPGGLFAYLDPYKLSAEEKQALGKELIELVDVELAKSEGGSGADDARRAVLSTTGRRSMAEFLSTLENPDAPVTYDVAEVEKYHDSGERQYVESAERDLAWARKLKSADGQTLPVYLAGLSVGGTVALRLAELHPKEVAGVIAYAPLLLTQQKAGQQGLDLLFLRLVGPTGALKFGWGTREEDKFSLGCLTAVDGLGMTTIRDVEKLKGLPMYVVLTHNDNDDAANPRGTLQFLHAARDKAAFPVDVGSFTYPKQARVPHPMVHPLQVSQGMTNAYWKGLYAESLRFFSRGIVERENFYSSDYRFMDDAAIAKKHANNPADWVLGPEADLVNEYEKVLASRFFWPKN